MYFNEIVVVYGIPLAVFCISFLLFYVLAKARNLMGLICFGLLWVGFTGTMFFGLEQSSGMNGLGYLLGLIGLSAPVGAGALIGGLIGWLRDNNKVRHA